MNLKRAIIHLITMTCLVGSGALIYFVGEVWKPAVSTGVFYYIHVLPNQVFGDIMVLASPHSHIEPDGMITFALLFVYA